MRRLYDDAALAALESPTMEPPPRSDVLEDGPTAELRDSMARFSTGDDHAARRERVEAAIRAVDPALLHDDAHERTLAVGSAHPADERIEAIADVGLVVPTQALLAALGVSGDELAGLAADVSAVVAVIGRGEPSTAATDDAAERLTEAFADRPEGAVATISLLYQNHDATSALFAAVLLAHATGEERRPALARTVRRATGAARLGDEYVDADETVEVSLEADGLEFGAGPHACPGESLATAIVDAMVAALGALDLQVDASAIVLGADGRAVALPLTPATTDDDDPDAELGTGSDAASA